MTEFEKEIALIEKMGLKTSPLRLEYEKKVHELRSMPEKLKAEGYTEDQIARVMHEMNETAEKYGDPLGPTYEMLRGKKTSKQIIESASRPIEDLDDRLTLDGFQQWYKTFKNLQSN